MKFKRFLAVLSGLTLVALAAFCVILRISPTGGKNAVLAAASLALPDGSFQSESEYVEDKKRQNTEASREINSSETKTLFSSEVYSEDPKIYEGEEQYPVTETTYREGDTSFDNLFIKNTTGLNLDVQKYLERDLGFDFKKETDVQVLIMHTHTSESYLNYDNGYYHESFYPRSSNPDRNVVRVGEEIKSALEANGIGVVHATEFHDDPLYTGAYYRSYDTALRYMEEYPDIKVVLDIHRDSISSGETGGKVKPVFYVDGKKAAQIMIMAGYDPDGSLEYPFWEDNLTFALKIQKKAEDMYPGMTRPLYFGNFVYNMNLNTGSMLIEVGTDANTLEEAVFTGGLLGNVLAEVLQSE